MPTYRVKVRICSDETYEIDCASKEEAETYWAEGAMVYKTPVYEDVEEVTVIDG